MIFVKRKVGRMNAALRKKLRMINESGYVMQLRAMRKSMKFSKYVV
jgi:hypothetical protein